MCRFLCCLRYLMWLDVLKVDCVIMVWVGFWG